MRLFKTGTTRNAEPPVAVVAKPPVVEGWSERELTAVYNAAPVRRFNKKDALFSDAEQSDSFFVIIEGQLQVVVKWDGYAGRPGILRRGDCIAPLPKSPGLLYSSEALEPCTVIEITPTVLNHLPDKTQLSIYKVAVASTSRINAYIRAVNGEVSSKNQLVASYISRQHAERAAAVESEVIKGYLSEIPRMPTYAMDLAVQLLDDNASVQEIVEGIKTDAAIAGIVLRAVNSGQFAFHKKIETFYHACMILGLNNIYNLILREAIQSSMPRTDVTKQIHRHSCMTSVLCYEIASAAKDVQAQTAMTIGLLHNIGDGVRILMKDAYPENAQLINDLPPSKLGATLLKQWGIPERICAVIERQDLPEFMSPDMIAEEYRRDAAILHVAHVLEKLIAGEPLVPECTIYTRDYMGVLGLPQGDPEGLLRDRVLPNLLRNRHRLPDQIRHLIEKHAE
jgi:HD-like signal output (HDOD) protein/CRP-like cAMP-binding protein